MSRKYISIYTINYKLYIFFDNSTIEISLRKLLMIIKNESKIKDKSV